MTDDIEIDLDKIIKDPDLFNEIVDEFIKLHPSLSDEEIYLKIIKYIAEKSRQQADAEKLKRQEDIALDRVLSKTLNRLPDSGDISIKKSIKEASWKVSSSSTHLEREFLADSLDDYSIHRISKIKRRKNARHEIENG